MNDSDRRGTNAGELEAERRTEDDAQEGEPTHPEAHVFGELGERRLDAWYPDCLDRACYDRVGDVSEGNDAENVRMSVACRIGMQEELRRRLRSVCRSAAERQRTETVPDTPLTLRLPLEDVFRSKWRLSRAPRHGEPPITRTIVTPCLRGVTICALPHISVLPHLPRSPRQPSNRKKRTLTG